MMFFKIVDTVEHFYGKTKLNFVNSEPAESVFHCFHSQFKFLHVKRIFLCKFSQILFQLNSFLTDMHVKLSYNKYFSPNKF